MKGNFVHDSNLRKNLNHYQTAWDTHLKSGLVPSLAHIQINSPKDEKATPTPSSGAHFAKQIKKKSIAIWKINLVDAPEKKFKFKSWNGGAGDKIRTEST